MNESDIRLPDSDATKPCKLAIFLIEGFAMLSYAAVVEPFRAANILAGKTLYHWKHCSVGGDVARASNGVDIRVDGTVADMDDPDLLFVIAGSNPAPFGGARAFNRLRALARRGTILIGISRGPFLLAQAGLLDGYRATIHWEHQPEFRERFPNVDLHPTLFVIDRQRVTCAGGTAGLDLAVEMIARVHGRLLANRVAEWFIRADAREADRNQRASLVDRYGISNAPLLRALAHMEANLEDISSRDRIAAAAGVSARQLERLFREHLQSTPGKIYMGLRLAHAAHLVRMSDLPLAEISAATGFQSASHFSRAFRSCHGQSPQALRREHQGRMQAIRPG